MTLPRRQRLRLDGFDYSSPGYYFVTICSNLNNSYFGDLRNGRVSLNPIGQLVEQCWTNIPEYYANVSLDEYVVMPNHIHGIIIIHNHRAVDDRPCGQLSNIVKSFKSSVTKTARKKFSFPHLLWHRSFRDDIIRSNKDLTKIRQYIQNNPIRTGDYQSPDKNSSPA